ncbi:MAG: HD domain-containing protein [Treponema sp.]|nr:HD domain-containing protein [Treponema sp.]
MNDSKLPGKKEADDLLVWAYGQNPGPWALHSRTVARAAETIALRCGLEGGKAYVLGLLHDIGRYEGVTDLRHIYSGYSLMDQKGYSQNARICLTHSFPYRDINSYSGKNDCAKEETEKIQSLLENYIYDDYDRLIQLCDAICMADGVSFMEARLIDVARRHKILNTDILNKWNAFFVIKEYFDKKCGMNIYSLFREEIINKSFN